MLTDRERLKKIREELIGVEKVSYAIYKKKNVLDKLIYSTDRKTGMLSFPIIIPIYEHDGSFLKTTLTSLNYFPKYVMAYNDYYRTTCYNVTL